MHRLLALLLLVVACGPGPRRPGDECKPTSCQALGKNCGLIDLGCGMTELCGECSGDATCGGGGVENVCGSPGCTPESDAAQCEGWGLQCGSKVVTDNCGATRTINCGACEGGASCQANQCAVVDPGRAPGSACTSASQCAGGVNARCDTNQPGGYCLILGCTDTSCPTGSFCLQAGDGRACVEGRCTTTSQCSRRSEGYVCDADQSCWYVPQCQAESNTAFCARLQKSCGSVTGVDDCGVTRTVTCGTCEEGETCSTSTNTCVCQPESNDAFCARQAPLCDFVSLPDNCGSWRGVECGCTNGLQCVSGMCQEVCEPETEAELCAATGSDCYFVTTDRCGETRSLFCGNHSGQCGGTDVCGGSGTRGRCGKVQTNTMPSYSSGTLRGVFGFSDSDVWAVGDFGAAFHFNGTSWRKVTTPVTTSPGSASNTRLYDVWGASANDVWAVGEGGTILRWNGSAWSKVTIPGEIHPLYAVWGLAANDVFVLGENGTFRRWNGSDWSSGGPITSDDLSGIWGTGADALWTTDLQSHVRDFDGSNWSSTNVGTNGLEAVTGTPAGEVAVAGDDDVHWFENGLWKREGVVTNGSIGRTLRAIAFASRTDGWAAGDEGLFRRDTQGWYELFSVTTSVSDIWVSPTKRLWFVSGTSVGQVQPD